MPVTLNPFPNGRYPIWMLALLPLGMFLAGHGLALLAAPTGTEVGAVQTITSSGTVTTTRTVKRVVHGKVVTRDEKVYVQVPVVIVHTDHHTIRVPQHLLPLVSAAATVADPLVTVSVQVPVTVYVPTTVTVTSVSTVTVPTTITVTVPLEGGGPDT